MESDTHRLNQRTIARSAKGLMQLMPATARAMGVPPGKEQNPEESVKAAIKYIAATDRSFSIHSSCHDKQLKLFTI